MSIQPFEFRESTPNTRLVFVGNGMCIPQPHYKHSVPTKSTPNARVAFVGTQYVGIHSCYKHFVPMGLKKGQDNRLL
ncbi:hypothetical protein C6497_01025 [Candidatus Poribacteria bacterium]|nr:MAG: hypothetical protein C6497_01025 [Candidatus Poribacteria bacterium]